MLKVRKYKVDEWVYYDYDPLDNMYGDYKQKAIILRICSQTDISDYEIYIEKTSKFKLVKEETLFSLKEE